MNPDVIKSASKKLKLRDIVLHDFSLNRNNDIDPISYPTKFIQQSNIGGRSDLVIYESEGFKDKKDKIFRNFVTFSIKAIDENLSGESSKNDSQEIVIFELEATYRLDYLVVEELNESEINEFAQFNCTHNAWPFWRQFVFQTVNEGHLPRLDIPLMQGFKMRTDTLKGVTSKKKKIAKKKTKKKTASKI
jgi:preprotein translocase subunit SecB